MQKLTATWKHCHAQERTPSSHAPRPTAGDLHPFCALDLRKGGLVSRSVSCQIYGNLKAFTPSHLRVLKQVTTFKKLPPSTVTYPKPVLLRRMSAHPEVSYTVTSEEDHCSFAVIHQNTQHQGVLFTEGVAVQVLCQNPWKRGGGCSFRRWQEFHPTIVQRFRIRWPTVVQFHTDVVNGMEDTGRWHLWAPFSCLFVLQTSIILILYWRKL